MGHNKSKKVFTSVCRIGLEFSQSYSCYSLCKWAVDDCTLPLTQCYLYLCSLLYVKCYTYMCHEVVQSQFHPVQKKCEFFYFFFLFVYFLFLCFFVVCCTCLVFTTSLQGCEEEMFIMSSAGLV